MCVYNTEKGTFMTKIITKHKKKNNHFECHDIILVRAVCCLLKNKIKILSHPNNRTVCDYYTFNYLLPVKSKIQKRGHLILRITSIGSALYYVAL